MLVTIMVFMILNFLALVTINSHLAEIHKLKKIQTERDLRA